MARIKYSYGLLDTHAKCTNKGLLGNGVSRGLRTRVSLSSKKDPIYGVSSEKGRLLFRELGESLQTRRRGPAPTENSSEDPRAFGLLEYLTY